MKKIVIADVYKRILANIIDGFFLAFLTAVLAMYVAAPFSNAVFGYSNYYTEGIQYQVASHLYVQEQLNNDSQQYEIVEVKDYTEKLSAEKESRITSLVYVQNVDSSYVIEHVRYYYESYLTNQNVELPNPKGGHTYDPVLDKFVAPSYNDAIPTESGDVLPKDFYTEQWFNQNILKVGDESSVYIYNSTNEVVVKEGIEEAAVLNYSHKLAYNAQKHLFESQYFANINNSIKWIQIFNMGVPYLLMMCVMYLLPSMIFANGETLGKKFMGICLVNSKGYCVTKPQVLLRFLVFFVEITFSLVIVGVGLTSLATLGIGVVLLLVGTLVNKNKRALHDYAAGTMVVITKSSMFFKNLEEEEAYEKKIQEEMDKYKSVEVENKNLIQVGSKVIEKTSKNKNSVNTEEKE